MYAPCAYVLCSAQYVLSGCPGASTRPARYLLVDVPALGRVALEVHTGLGRDGLAGPAAAAAPAEAQRLLQEGPSGLDRRRLEKKDEKAQQEHAAHAAAGRCGRGHGPAADGGGRARVCAICGLVQLVYGQSIQCRSLEEASTAH